MNLHFIVTLDCRFMIIWKVEINSEGLFVPKANLDKISIPLFMFFSLCLSWNRSEIKLCVCWYLHGSREHTCNSIENRANTLCIFDSATQCISAKLVPKSLWRVSTPRTGPPMMRQLRTFDSSVPHYTAVV